MVYKPTGRPIGRPKTTETVTLLARVPADLAGLVRRYAKQHGQSVAELLREGITWRIGDGDPRGLGVYLAQPTGMREKEYSSNPGISLGAPGEEVLQEVRAMVEGQAAQIQTMIRMLEQMTAASVREYSSNIQIAPSASTALPTSRAKSSKAGIIARLQQMRDTGLDSSQIAATLQADGIPTLSGKGQWHAGTVRKLLLVLEV